MSLGLAPKAAMNVPDRRPCVQQRPLSAMRSVGLRKATNPRPVNIVPDGGFQRLKLIRNVDMVTRLSRAVV